jgi:hypothetical protein
MSSFSTSGGTGEILPGRDLRPSAVPRLRRIFDAPWARRLAGVASPLARNRLVQFLAIGGFIFAIAPRPVSSRSIPIRRDRLDALHAAEATRKHVPMLPPDKVHEVDQRAVEDEILYREGVRLGLDKNDGIVRQRIVQKVLFLAEEVAGASRPPQEAELRAFFEAHRERWKIPERFHFAHVFARRRESLPAPSALSDGAPRGEPSPLPPDFEGTREQIVTRLGAPFADALAGLREGVWSEPIASPFGFHLVRLVKRDAARPARFEEVRPAVIEAAGVFLREEAVARFLESAFSRYEVTIDGQPLRDFKPLRRVAVMSVSSGED